MIISDTDGGKVLSTRQLQEALNKTMRLIDADAPAVDAVEVVRCRDCNYWLHGECDLVAQRMDGDTIGVGLETDGEHFCSWAERRQDGERD